MLERVFAVVADEQYFDGLWALLNSVVAYHGADLMVYVFDAGMRPGQLHALRSSPAPMTIVPAADLPFGNRGPWESKQQVLAYTIGRARVVLLLDADLVLTSNVDDVFEQASEGLIVTCRDGVDGVVFGPEYARYSSRLVETRSEYFNSGFLCVDVVVHWDLSLLWAYSCLFGQYSLGGGAPIGLPGHGDQGVLVAIAALLSKGPSLRVLPADEWCDCWGRDQGRPPRIVEAAGSRLCVICRTGRRQRLVHNAGPKWWTDAGRKWLEGYGDVLACFEHFHKLRPVCETAEEAASVAYRGACPSAGEDAHELRATVAESSAFDSGSRISDSLYEVIIELLAAHRPKLIVETGSGLSTLVFARYCTVEGARACSLEDCAEYGEAVAAAARASGGRADVLHCPLESGYYRAAADIVTDWSGGALADLILLDGPVDSSARYGPAVEKLLSSTIGPNTVIVVDDTHRAPEAMLVEWLARSESASTRHVIEVDDPVHRGRESTVLLPPALAHLMRAGGALSEHGHRATSGHHVPAPP